MATVDDPIAGGVPAATPGGARSYLGRINADARRPGAPLPAAELDAIIAAFRRWGPVAAIRWDVALAQAIHETNGFRFGNQVKAGQRNVGGIGATNDGAPGSTNPDWDTGAKQFYVHHWAWLVGNDPARVPEGLRPHFTTAIDARIPAVASVRAVKGPTTTWRSLGGRWGVRIDVPWQDQATMPDNYGDRVQRHYDAMLAEPKEEVISMGQVPRPPISVRLIGIPPKINGVGVDRGQKRVPKFSVVHRMVGTLWGTDKYFRDPTVRGLTDFGIGYEDIGRGFAEFLQWCDIYGPLIPWASGPVKGPIGDGPRALAAFGGPEGVNRFGVSVELDDRGRVTTPVSAAQWSALVWFLAWLHAEVLEPNQTAATFDWNMHHREFTKGTGKDCPEPPLYNFTDAYQEAVKATMRHFQEGAPWPAGGLWVNGKKLALPPDTGAAAVVAQKIVVLPPAVEDPQAAITLDGHRIGGWFRLFHEKVAPEYRLQTYGRLLTDEFGADVPGQGPTTVQVFERGAFVLNAGAPSGWGVTEAQPEQETAIREEARRRGLLAA